MKTKTVKTGYYIVIDQDNVIWERAFDFKDSGDYYPKDLKTITKNNLLSLKNATKLKNELDKEISSCNNITFTIKNVSITIE